MKQQIRWGIIGCGNVTEVKSGPAFNKVDHSALVAVMRRNEEKVKDYALRHNVPKWYTDAFQLIKDPNVNALYIATPPDTHEAYTIAALQEGKPVYVEKPMALDAASAEKMVHAANYYKVKICVAHYRREQPLFKKIKELIETGVIGDVQIVNLRMLQPHHTNMIAQTEEPWRLNPSISGGGLFHDLAPHGLDLMPYFFGIPLQVKGISFNKGGHYAADDTVSGIIQFNNNILFNGIWSFTVAASEATDHCEIIGTAGKISFFVFKNQTISIIKNGHAESIHFDALQHVQKPMIQKVVDYFHDEGYNPCTAEEGWKVMQMMDAMTQKNKYENVGSS